MTTRSTWELPIIDANDEMLAATKRALQPKVARFVRSIWLPRPPDDHTCGLWERGDVEGEAYLAFAGVVDCWPPSMPFGRYFLAHFPWRLREAVVSSLAYPRDEIVRCHILEGLTMAATAERLGVDRRTMTRHWGSILQSLRA